MTTFTYTQKQVLLFKNKSYISALSEKFYIINDQGIITNSIIAWIGIAVVCYLIAMYSLFGITASMRHQDIILKDLADTKVQVELNVQQIQAGFARNNQNILESMEKISEIRYIISNDIAVSRLEINGQASQ